MSNSMTLTEELRGLEREMRSAADAVGQHSKRYDQFNRWADTLARVLAEAEKAEAVGFVKMVYDEWQFRPLFEATREQLTDLRHGCKVYLHPAPPSVVTEARDVAWAVSALDELAGKCADPGVKQGIKNIAGNLSAAINPEKQT